MTKSIIEWAREVVATPDDFTFVELDLSQAVIDFAEALKFIEGNAGHVTPCTGREEMNCYAGCEFANVARTALAKHGVGNGK